MTILFHQFRGKYFTSTVRTLASTPGACSWQVFKSGIRELLLEWVWGPLLYIFFGEGGVYQLSIKTYKGRLLEGALARVLRVYFIILFFLKKHDAVCLTPSFSQVNTDCSLAKLQGTLDQLLMEREHEVRLVKANLFWFLKNILSVVSLLQKKVQKQLAKSTDMPEEVNILKLFLNVSFMLTLLHLTQIKTLQSKRRPRRHAYKTLVSKFFLRRLCIISLILRYEPYATIY